MEKNPSIIRHCWFIYNFKSAKKYEDVSVLHQLHSGYNKVPHNPNILRAPPESSILFLRRNRRQRRRLHDRSWLLSGFLPLPITTRRGFLPLPTTTRRWFLCSHLLPHSVRSLGWGRNNKVQRRDRSREYVYRNLCCDWLLRFRFVRL